MFQPIKGVIRSVKRCVSLILAICLFLSLTSCKNAHETAGEASCRREIIIDPGHGGVDGGAVGISGVVEKQVNLDICLKLRSMLMLMGYNVIMTRDSDISIHDKGANTIRQMKTSDLHNRLKIANDHNNAAYLSIHQNKFSDSSQSGMCFYYSPNNENSKLLADTLHGSMLEHLQPDNRRQVKCAGDSLFIMYNATNPAVLIECGFLSNAQEEQLLTSDEYQYKICLMIIDALTKMSL